MRILLARFAFIAALVGSSAVVAGKAPLDAGLYTQYALYPNQVNFETCGTVGNVNQCWNCCGNFNLGPFEAACAVIDGAVTKKKNVLTRNIYVFDSRSDKNNPVLLYIYKRTDTFTENNDTLSMTLDRTVSLDLKGGPTAKCFVAANDVALYVGTDQDKIALVVDKKSYGTTQLGPTFPVTQTSSITADDKGYIAVVFGGDSFYTFAPDGSGLSAGGGLVEFVNDRNAIQR